MGLCARDIMESPAKTVPPDMTLVELERTLLADRVTGYPVVEENRLLGIVSRSDIVRQLSLEQNVAEQLSDYYRDLGKGPDSGQDDHAVAHRVGDRLESLHVKDAMIRELITVDPETSLETVAKLLVSHRIHRLPVTDGDTLMGIVSAFDLVRLFAEGRAKV